MTKPTKRFLIVDDDSGNNALSKMALKRALGAVEVTAFVIPESGLEYIETKYVDESGDEKTTLLLDINMPTMTGWEFLEKFDTFKEDLKNQFDIYILSSSVDPTDIERAKLNPFVRDFIEKPLNKIAILKMLG